MAWCVQNKLEQNLPCELRECSAMILGECQNEESFLECLLDDQLSRDVLDVDKIVFSFQSTELHTNSCFTGGNF